MIEFILNDKDICTNLPRGWVLLDFIRKEAHLTGVKEGCREGDCGACTVLLGEIKSDGSYGNEELHYKYINSCLMPLGDIHGKHIVTIEGLNREELTPIQKAIVEEGGTQCGFCTPGFIVSLTGYFLINQNYKALDAIDSMNGNICRCTGYSGIKRAAEKVSSNFNLNNNEKLKLERLIQSQMIPDYFRGIKKRLIELNKKLANDVRAGSFNQFEFLISGGTDLYVQKWESIINSQVSLISTEKKFSFIEEVDGEIRIGSTTTISELEYSSLLNSHFPDFRKYLRLFGSIPIRNRATVGGNIVNASPIGDVINILLALDAKVHITNEKSKREILLKNFFKGYKTLDLNTGELIEAVSFPAPKRNSNFNFEKISKRTFLDIASVNSSMYIEFDDKQISEVRISAGGVAPIPMYLMKTRNYLLGKSISEEVATEAGEIAMSEISPISDARGTAEYKSLLLRQLIFAHFIKLFPEYVNDLAMV
jgi:xanthine dehydrogenase small subunit